MMLRVPILLAYRPISKSIPCTSSVDSQFAALRSRSFYSLMKNGSVRQRDLEQVREHFARRIPECGLQNAALDREVVAMLVILVTARKRNCELGSLLDSLSPKLRMLKVSPLEQSLARSAVQLLRRRHALVQQRSGDSAATSNQKDLCVRSPPDGSGTGQAEASAAVEDVHSRAVEDVHSRAVEDVHSAAGEDVHSAAVEDVHSAAGEDVHSRAVEDVHSAAVEDVHSAAVEDVHSAAGEDVHSRAGEDVHSAAVEDVHSAAGEDVHSAAVEDVHSRAGEDIQSGQDGQVSVPRRIGVSDRIARVRDAFSQRRTVATPPVAAVPEEGSAVPVATSTLGGFHRSLPVAPLPSVSPSAPIPASTSRSSPPPPIAKPLPQLRSTVASHRVPKVRPISPELERLYSTMKAGTMTSFELLQRIRGLNGLALYLHAPNEKPAFTRSLAAASKLRRDTAKVPVPFETECAELCKVKVTAAQARADAALYHLPRNDGGDVALSEVASWLSDGSMRHNWFDCAIPTCSHLTDLAEDSPALHKATEERKALSAYKYRHHVCNLVQPKSITIVVGSTGCGKSTQVPQFLWEQAISKGAPFRALLCQPRRVAATSLAARIRNERLMDLYVHHHVHMSNEALSSSRIVVATHGVALESMVHSEAFRYVNGMITHLIVDEIHERCAESDGIVAMALSAILGCRPDLSLVVMSASSDLESTLQYIFRRLDVGSTAQASEADIQRLLKAASGDGSPFACVTINGIPVNVINLSTRLNYPVQRYYLEPSKSSSFERQHATFALSQPSDAIEKIICLRVKDEETPALINIIAEAVIHACQADYLGAILVFIPTLAWISAVAARLTHTMREKGLRLDIKIAASVIGGHDDLFLPPKSNHRKVILSTKMCETSVTIPDVTIVVDVPIAVQSSCYETNELMPFDLIAPERTIADQSSHLQRCGRVGRRAPGKVFVLCTEEFMATVPKRWSPAESSCATKVEDLLQLIECTHTCKELMRKETATFEEGIGESISLMHDVMDEKRFGVSLLEIIFYQWTVPDSRSLVTFASILKSFGLIRECLFNESGLPELSRAFVLTALGRKVVHLSFASGGLFAAMMLVMCDACGTFDAAIASCIVSRSKWSWSSRYTSSCDIVTLCEIYPHLFASIVTVSEKISRGSTGPPKRYFVHVNSDFHYSWANVLERFPFAVPKCPVVCSPADFVQLRRSAYAAFSQEAPLTGKTSFQSSLQLSPLTQAQKSVIHFAAVTAAVPLGLRARLPNGSVLRALVMRPGLSKVPPGAGLLPYQFQTTFNRRGKYLPGHTADRTKFRSTSTFSVAYSHAWWQGNLPPLAAAVLGPKLCRVGRTSDGKTLLAWEHSRKLEVQFFVLVDDELADMLIHYSSSLHNLIIGTRLAAPLSINPAIANLAARAVAGARSVLGFDAMHENSSAVK